MAEVFVCTGCRFEGFRQKGSNCPDCVKHAKASGYGQDGNNDTITGSIKFDSNPHKTPVRSAPSQ